jgi:hypothetical protein
MSDDHERRLTSLEVEHRHLVATVDKMSQKVDEMHVLLTKAKGARWAVLALVSLASFFAGQLGNFLPFGGGK